ncbi:MAG: FG-GAP repeat protein [Planctomycetes bacterium]|nr:FG-GAP repeat protein [Planctomycetota bacterium]
MICSLLALFLSLVPTPQVGGSWEPGFNFSPNGLHRPFGAADLVPDLDGDGLDEFLIGSDRAVALGLDGAGAAMVLSGADGSLLHLFEGTASSEQLGMHVHCPGDLDLDGAADLLYFHIVAGEDRVSLHSGRTGARIVDLAAPSVNGWDIVHFGWGLGSVTDQDGDGVRDLLIGAPRSGPTGSNDDLGAAFLYSGATRTLLRTHLGTAGADYWMGSTFADLGDLDSDGLPDYAIASVRPGYISSVGLIRLHSGATGATIRQLLPPPGVIGFGSSLDAGQDLDGDLVPDLLVGSPGYSENWAFAVSGATGSTLLALQGGPNNRFGWSVAFAGDLQGSPTSEILVGAPREDAVFLFDATGQLLHRSTDGPPGSYFGQQVLAGAAFDHDGVPDWAVLSWAEDALGVGSGALRSYSGASFARLHFFPGSAETARAGSSFVRVGDWDQDGTADFAVGLPDASLPGLPSTGAVEVRSGRDFSLIHRWEGTGDRDSFGWSLAAASDHDGDGVADLFVGARTARNAQGAKVGAVLLFGSAGAAQLQRWEGTNTLGSFGHSLALLGDLDRDGLRDLAVGAPGASALYGPSKVTIHSARTGAVLHRLVSSTIDGFGHCLSVGHDANGDGVPDLLIGAPDDHGGRVEVRSGATGNLIQSVPSPGAGNQEQFGWSVAWIGDLDGDGNADFAAGSPGAVVPEWQAGAVYLFSGRTGRMLFRRFGSRGFERLGQAVRSMGDLDLDGTPDFGVSSPKWSETAGAVHLLSGATGGTLRLLETEGTHAWNFFLESDLNRDDIPDLVIGDSYANGSLGKLLRLRFDPFLEISPKALSSALGGAVSVGLAFPDTEASMLYAVLASATGASPTTVAGVVIPLTQDRMFRLSSTSAAAAYLPGHQGRLDADGDAALTLSFGPGVLTPLIGRSLYLAALSGSDPQTGRLSSAARTIEVLP